MAKSVRRSRFRARGSASTSAHHASPVDSCGCDHERRWTASRACTMAATSLATSGRTASSRTKFGGMAVPAAQLDLGRAFQEELSCPFDERRQIFVCEDGALVPEQISFKFHFRELVVGVDGIAESLIAIQSGLKYDCRHPAKVVMLGRVLRPASAVRPTGELAAFLVFRIGRHRQSSWASRPIIVLALLLSCFSMRRSRMSRSKLFW